MTQHEPTETAAEATTAGTTRRQMLTRSAVVGGSVLWMAPVVQSLGPSAFAVAGSEPPTGEPETAFTLGLRGDETSTRPFDFTLFSYTNSTGAGGANLIALSITIGNTARNYDRFLPGTQVSPAGVTTTVLSPDALNGGSRSDVFSATFAPGIAPGLSGQTSLEIDPDSSNAILDFRTVLFNNGGTNAVATFTFDNGDVKTVELTGSATATSFAYAG